MTWVSVVGVLTLFLNCLSLDYPRCRPRDTEVDVSSLLWKWYQETAVGEWRGETGKANTAIMGELLRKFSLWIIGTYSYYATLRTSVAHEPRSYPNYRRRQLVHLYTTSYQSLIEGGVNCLVLQPSQAGQLELRESPQAEKHRSWQLALGQYKDNCKAGRDAHGPWTDTAPLHNCWHFVPENRRRTLIKKFKTWLNKTRVDGT